MYVVTVIYSSTKSLNVNHCFFMLDDIEKKNACFVMHLNYSIFSIFTKCIFDFFLKQTIVRSNQIILWTF